MSCIESLVRAFAPKKMICAHGDEIVEDSPGHKLLLAWSEGVGFKTNQKEHVLPNIG